MATAANECAKLAGRFNTMAADGLVDVKFYLRNLDEAAGELVCNEVNRLYDSLDKGECVPLDFRDSYRS